METRLVIDELVTGHKAVTPDEGEPIFCQLLDLLAKDYSVELDFTGIEMMTTAFLNVVIGDLYKTYTSDQLRLVLRFSGLDEAGKRRIKKVTDTAKEFYQNPSQFSKIVNSVVDGSI